MEPTKGRRMLWAGDGQRQRISQRTEKSKQRGREGSRVAGARPLRTMPCSPGLRGEVLPAAC